MNHMPQWYLDDQETKHVVEKTPRHDKQLIYVNHSATSERIHTHKEVQHENVNEQCQAQENG
jgi:hypothetical protein